MSLPLGVGADQPPGRHRRHRHDLGLGRPRDREHRRVDARPGCRHRLRPVRPRPAPAEHRDRDVGLHESVGRANATAGLSVLFAGSTVVLAIAGLQLAGVPMMAAMGWTSALMVAVTMLAALTLLPALLGLAGKRINSLAWSVPGTRPATAHVGRAGGPATWPTTPCATLVAAVAPGRAGHSRASRMRIGFPDDGNDGTESTTRRSYDMLADGFGPASTVPSRSSSTSHGAADPDGVRRRGGRALEATPGHQLGHAAGRQPGRRPRGADRTPDTSPQAEETAELVAAPPCRRAARPVGDAYGGEVMVTGNSALQDDLSASCSRGCRGSSRAVHPAVAARPHPGVPVGVGAAQGRRPEPGQHRGVVRRPRRGLPVGLGRGVVGIHETMPIKPLAPMLMFAILFGLSMDYEVFLLGRVREEYRAHRDPRASLIARA